jgi:prepilin-type N-terminal cleavage/methylation domain-containing protein/prepilin-type processing-associated H-X9-DG protein
VNRIRRSAFSLAELLVVMAIISVLVALVLPAVQSAREAARRSTCLSHLHNHAAALAQYHAAHGQLPPGRFFGKAPSSPPRGDEEDHSWSWAALVLPDVEQGSLYDQLDFSEPAGGPQNRTATATALVIFRCPSTAVDVAGGSDYSGLTGTAMQTRPAEESDQSSWDVFNRGMLINANELKEGIKFGQATDGLSHTLIVAENANVAGGEDGFWANACVMSHDSGNVNSDAVGIYSDHPGGANAARADGSASFLSDDVDPIVIGALCTRAAGD